MLKMNIYSSSLSDPQTFPPETLEKLKKFLASKPKLIIIAHASPDGDTLGSSLAFYAGLKSMGIPVHVACIDTVPDLFQFVPWVKEIQNDFDEQAYDGVIFMDAGDKRMTRFHEQKPRILSPDMIKINIDHHPTNDSFGDFNFIDTHAASSSQISFFLLQELGIKITPHMATCLILGIYTDTGAFMHQNTTPQSYEVASRLIKLGANINIIAKNVFRSYELKTLKLWGKVLENLYVTPDGAAIVGISRKEYESMGCKREDLGGVIDFINSMPEAKYSVLLSEDEKGNVKASLRTRKPDVDVKALAEKFGGGGHVKASGFTVKDSRIEKEVKWKIVQE